MTTLGEAHSILVARLISLRVPRIVGEPDAEDIRALGDHAVEVADAVDSYMAALAREIPGVDSSLFTRPLFGALEGNALYEVSRVADQINEDSRGTLR